MIKISFIIFIVGIILIFVGYSHQIKPKCQPNDHIEFIDEQSYNSLVKNNASKIYNQMKNKSTFEGYETSYNTNLFT